MSHDHDHTGGHGHEGHSHRISADADRSKLAIALGLILGFMAVEVTVESSPAPETLFNVTDSFFVDGGRRTMLHLIGDVVEGLTGLLCLAVESHSAPSGLIAEGG